MFDRNIEAVKEDAMSRYELREYSDMIEILTEAIAIHEKEEEFFRRCANQFVSENGKKLSLEIANDLSKYCTKLAERKSKVLEGLRHMQEEQNKGKALQLYVVG